MYTAEGTLVKWLRPNGSRVEQGDSVLEIETEKSVNEVIAPQNGILRHVADAGSLVKEEGLLGFVLAAGESMPAELGAPPVPPARSAEGAPSAVALGPAADGRVKASPIARRLAAEYGVDLTALRGSGPGGRILEADVVAQAARAQGQPLRKPATGGHPDSLKIVQRVPFTPMRRAIGESLRRGLDAAVPLTLTREVEVDQLVACRATLSARLGVSVPYDAFFIKLLALALREQPGLNAVIEDGALVTFDEVSIGFAVAVPDGLVVPVIRNADQTSLVGIVEATRRLAERARARQLQAADFAGAVSTVTNLGAYGVDAFTPVLNPPQCTILGIGRIARRPVARADALAVAHTCSLCLTLDHRATDGAPAARLLDDIGCRLNDSAYLSSLLER
jgi:pyruvate dehydrogenase E2 component (dihydrolipoamide acetyltransferase)